MTEIIGVRFKEIGKSYYFDPDGRKFEKGEFVVVETVRGLECGKVVMENREIPDDKITQPLKKPIRVADEKDIEKLKENKAKSLEAFEICRKKIERHKLDMKLVDAEYAFDGGKLVFYFTADGRVDFRELVKDLASAFRTRIELRQIGIRDSARAFGGLGVCGKSYCCKSFLDEFQPVSIKMAKEQGLSLNPAKISGACGRLMCCLRYEQDFYEELLKNAPRPGAVVKTNDGVGQAVDLNPLAGLVRVQLQGNPAAPPKTFKCEDVKLIKYSQIKVEKTEKENLKGTKD